MSCYKFPKRLIYKLQQLISCCWKNKSPDFRSITWDSWSSICPPKRHRGLGLRHLDAFNQALLAKHGWRFLTNPDSLCVKIMKAKYFPNTGFLKANNGKNSSYSWSSILWGRELLKKGVGWKLGTCLSINVWEDNWIPSDTMFKPFVSNKHIYQGLTVADLIDQRTHTWNMLLI